MFVLVCPDRRKPNGDDKFSGSVGENVGNCGASSEEKPEERNGAFLSSFGVQYLWPAGQHRE